MEFAGHCIRIRRRARRRTIAITVKQTGEISVAVAKGASLSQIREFLVSQSDWLQTQVAKFAQHRSQFPSPELRDLDLVPFRGKDLSLVYQAVDRRTISLRWSENQLLFQIPSYLWQNFEPKDPHPEFLGPLSRWYEAEARHWLTPRIEHWSHQMGVKPTSLSFRAQRTRWGSCSHRGHISLNWRMIVAPDHVTDYVLIHELAHLRHYDHSSRFWDFVAEFCPEFNAARNWLKENQLRADFLRRGK